MGLTKAGKGSKIMLMVDASGLPIAACATSTQPHESTLVQPPHRSNRRPENNTQDGRPLRRYRRRWVVERSFTWLHHFRRLCIRWEPYSHLYQAILHFACSYLLAQAILGELLIISISYTGSILTPHLQVLENAFPAHFLDIGIQNSRFLISRDGELPQVHGQPPSDHL